ncbi:MAG: ribosome maturation factor RimP [Ancrocorticia sp.]|nr:ribosome maturation factor RimP [Ancrocorticia sp.]MCI1895379.1 ribosome maturation factor RimP [Ancrocorticia sp.]MCI1932014.1 ribosome maturation factor RimP [Ancrocorticia sp.]MCI1963375.1 ribosome maturation factor RimP [Ancrocorticia sp.]MCI2003160.1 ribosome maturation factor RimP [Ancrocorticia sp.]
MAHTKRNKSAWLPDKHNSPKAKDFRPRDKSANSTVEDLVKEQVNPLVDSAGLYLEQVKVGRTGGRTRVKVVVDLPWGPGGVDSDRLTELSRAISHVLDDADIVQGSYTLEVSTPGVERPLTEPRHFSRAQGRLLSLRLSDGEALTARLKEVKGATLIVRTVEEERLIDMSRVVSARVIVELSKANEFDEA